eukprot:scaffold618_cov175-Amphora_coffeaeformis.AAC.2
MMIDDNDDGFRLSFVGAGNSLHGELLHLTLSNVRFHFIKGRVSGNRARSREQCDCWRWRERKPLLSVIIVCIRIR